MVRSPPPVLAVQQGAACVRGGFSAQVLQTSASSAAQKESH